MRHASTLLATALLGATAALAAPAADAATLRIRYVSATNACQPATPLELGGLRYRPLGIFNNKNESIYISCSLDTEFNGDQTTNEVYVFFDNQGTVARTVDCTIQGGSRSAGVNNYPATLNLAAGANDIMVVSAIDKVSTSYTHMNLSCLLPAKVEMGTIRLQQESVEDDI